MNFKLDVYFHLGDNFLSQIIERMDAMTPQLEDLTAKVDTCIEVQESAITLINGISEQLRAIKDDPAAIETLANELDAETTKLSEAVVNNTL